VLCLIGALASVRKVAAHKSPQFRNLAEARADAEKRVRLERIARIGDTARIGRIVLLPVDVSPGDSWFTKLDDWYRQSLSREFVEIVDRAAVDSAGRAASATRLPTSTQEQIQEEMLSLRAPLAVRTVVLTAGDSVTVFMSFYRLYENAAPDPSIRSAVSNNERSPGSASSLAKKLRAESWAPPALRYARKDSVQALMAAAARVRGMVEAMESCTTLDSRLQDFGTWCWKDPYTLIVASGRKLITESPRVF
jgi:hypothetical protein